ncbi:hypothetical protein BKA82DRAFT_4185703 [Pisolithus tinctorius]|nr:hypothetical protein BKA82DRAFT_4185703 [Pisolithus tinctorius]
MKLKAALAAACTLVFTGCSASGSPAEDSPSLLPPTAIPGTSAFPSTLPFDTTASSSFISALSSYISSQSAAAPSVPTPTPTSTSSSTAATATAPSVSVATPTTITSSPTSTSPGGTSSSGTSGMAAGRNYGLVGMSVITSVVLGTVVALF